MSKISKPVGRVRRSIAGSVLARHIQGLRAAGIKRSVAVRTNLSVEFYGAITAGAKSFGLGWDHEELDAVPRKIWLPAICEYLR
jgi:hypothetical protein